MLLIVLLFISNVVSCSHEPSAASAAAASSSSSIAMNVFHKAEDILCDAVLTYFYQGTGSLISEYVRPQLNSLIQEVANSPDDKTDSPAHVGTIKRMLSGDLPIDLAPKKELENIVLFAVQKTLESKEKELTNKSDQIESMFTKNSTIGISTVSGVVLAIIGTLAGAFGTKNSC